MLKKIISLFTSNKNKSDEFINDHYLYHYSSCPFCFRVIIAMKKLNIDMEKRNIHQGSEHFTALQNGGGSTMVPCLRIDNNGKTKWLYESSDIVHYLETNFSSVN